MKKRIALLLTGVMLLGLLSGCNTYQSDDSASSAGSTSNTADEVSADFTMAYNLSLIHIWTPMKIVEATEVRQRLTMPVCIDLMRASLRELEAGTYTQPLRSIALLPGGEKFGFMPACLGAVSYTHLDVYKRQRSSVVLSCSDI